MRTKVTVRAGTYRDYTHRVRYPGPGGKTLTKWFHNETQALAFEKEQNKALGIDGAAFGTLAADEKAVLEFWRAFVNEAADAPPPPLGEVVRDFAKRWRATRTSVTVSEAFDRFIATKEGEGLRALSVEGLRTRCGRFAGDFATRPICTLTTGEISDWLLGLVDTRKPLKVGEKAAQVSLLTKRNYRRDVATLFAFSKTRGWLAENPVTDAAKMRPPKQRPGVLTPEETAKFFVALELKAPALVPFWAVRFFAGVREQEALRMDWSMVDLKAKEIHLPDTVTKTGHDRTIKIEPVLAAFLEPLAQRSGPLTASTSMSRRYALEKVEKAAGVSLPKNGARHSFATYHLLAFRHAGETALQLGHGGSPELLHRHYKGVGTEKQAKAFWKIRPAKAANVVSITKGKGRRTA